MSDDILWSNSSPKDITTGINVDRVQGEPGTLVMYEGPPDWVRDHETHKPVRVSFARPVTDFDCRSCGAHIDGPVPVLFYPCVTHGGMWFTHPCPACNKFVSGLLMTREPKEGAKE